MNGNNERENFVENDCNGASSSLPISSINGLHLFHLTMHHNLNSSTMTPEKRLEQLRKLIVKRIKDVMEEKELRQQDLVDRTGKPKSYFTKLLQADANLTLRTVAELEYALGEKLLF